MRISLLERRENFYKILLDTLVRTSFLSAEDKSLRRNYCVNKYLNFVATRALGNSHFQVLVNEYSSSSLRWRNGAQQLYVTLAVRKTFRRLLSQRSIWLPSCFSDFLIIGGNHRIRLIASNLKSTVVILKHNESTGFIENDRFVRLGYNIAYAPKILEYGEDWIREEYFEGTPVNRISNLELKDCLLTKVCQAHMKQVVLASAVPISVSTYIDVLTKEIDLVIGPKVIDGSSKLGDIVRTTLNYLRSKIDKNRVRISWSHGDFQEANILVIGDYFKVIDWETANKRYYLYDFFVLFGEVRSKFSLCDSINLFINKMRLCFPSVKISDQEVIFLLLEELRFRISESFSTNFFQSGVGVKELCDAINAYLDEK